MKAKSLRVLFLVALLIIAAAWLIEALTFGRGFVSKYLAPVVIVANLGNGLHIAIQNRWLPQFSLRTLLVTVLLIGCAATLWMHWGPFVCVREFKGLPEGPHPTQFSHDGERLIICDGDFDITKIWLCELGTKLTVREINYIGRLPSVCFTKDNRWILLKGRKIQGNTYLAQSGRGMEVFDAHTGNRLLNEDHVSSVSFSTNEGLMLVTYEQNAAEIRGGITGIVHVVLGNSSEKPVNVGHISQNGALALIGKDIFDCTSGKPIRKLKDASDTLRASFSPDSKWIAVELRDAAGNSKVVIYETETGNKVATMKGDLPEQCFSPDGKLLLIHDLWETCIYRMDTNFPLVRKLTGRLPVGAFSRDGNKLVTYWYESSRKAGVLSHHTGFSGPLPKFSVGIVDLTTGRELAAYDSAVVTSQTEIQLAWWEKQYLIFGTLIWDSKSGTGTISESPSNGRWRTSSTFINGTQIIDAKTGEIITVLPLYNVHLSPDPTSDFLVGNTHTGVGIYRLNRPEYWWGVACLPEFWLFIVLLGGFVWSLWKDRREVRRKVVA